MTRKTLLAALTTTLATALAVPAASAATKSQKSSAAAEIQAGPNNAAATERRRRGLMRRARQLDRRIHAGVADGSLTRREARRLRGHQNKLERVIRRTMRRSWRHHGGSYRAEVMLDRQAQRIFRLRHNHQVAFRARGHHRGQREQNRGWRNTGWRGNRR